MLHFFAHRDSWETSKLVSAAVKRQSSQRDSGPCENCPCHSSPSQWVPQGGIRNSTSLVSVRNRYQTASYSLKMMQDYKPETGMTDIKAASGTSEAGSHFLQEAGAEPVTQSRSVGNFSKTLPMVIHWLCHLQCSEAVFLLFSSL